MSACPYRVVHHLGIHFVPGRASIRLGRGVGQMHAGGDGRTEVRPVVRLGRRNVGQRCILQYGGMRRMMVLAVLRAGNASTRLNGREGRGVALEGKQNRDINAQGGDLT